jgi:hypothetical protein
LFPAGAAEELESSSAKEKKPKIISLQGFHAFFLFFFCASVRPGSLCQFSLPRLLKKPLWLRVCCAFYLFQSSGDTSIFILVL